MNNTASTKSLDNKQNSITSKQLMLIILSAQIGLGILMFPSDISKVAGHDGWISIILGGGIYAIATVFIIKLMEKYSTKSIIEINKLLYGKYIGTAFNVIMVLYFVFITFDGLRLFQEFITITVLPLTSPLVITGLLILPVAYITWYGLKYLARFSYIGFPGLFATLLIIVLVHRQFNINFLLPINEAGITGILKGVYPTIFALLGPEIVGFVYPYIKDKENALKYSLLGNAFTTVFYVIVDIATTALYGEKMLQQMVIPIINLSRTYLAPVLERIDLYYFAVWVPNITISVGVFFFVAYLATKQIFNIRKRSAIILTVHVALGVILSRLPKNFNDAVDYLNMVSYLGMSTIIIMILGYFMSFINKRGIEKK